MLKGHPTGVAGLRSRLCDSDPYTAELESELCFPQYENYSLQKWATIFFTVAILLNT